MKSITLDRGCHSDLACTRCGSLAHFLQESHEEQQCLQSLCPSTLHAHQFLQLLLILWSKNKSNSQLNLQDDVYLLYGCGHSPCTWAPPQYYRTLLLFALLP